MTGGCQGLSEGILKGPLFLRSKGKYVRLHLSFCNRRKKSRICLSEGTTDIQNKTTFHFYLYLLWTPCFRTKTQKGYIGSCWWALLDKACCCLIKNSALEFQHLNTHILRPQITMSTSQQFGWFQRINRSQKLQSITCPSVFGNPRLPVS